MLTLPIEIEFLRPVPRAQLGAEFVLDQDFCRVSLVMVVPILAVELSIHGLALALFGVVMVIRRASKERPDA